MLALPSPGSAAALMRRPRSHRCLPRHEQVPVVLDGTHCTLSRLLDHLQNYLSACLYMQICLILVKRWQNKGRAAGSGTMSLCLKLLKLTRCAPAFYSALPLHLLISAAFTLSSYQQPFYLYCELHL